MARNCGIETDVEETTSFGSFYLVLHLYNIIFVFFSVSERDSRLKASVCYNCEYTTKEALLYYILPTDTKRAIKQISGKIRGQVSTQPTPVTTNRAIPGTWYVTSVLIVLRRILLYYIELEL